MIQSTKDKLADNAVNGNCGKGFPGVSVKRTRAMLTALDAAAQVKDLRFPPGNHLEELKGDRTGQHSVRINSQWRICFVWTPNSALSKWYKDYVSARDGRSRKRGIVALARKLLVALWRYATSGLVPEGAVLLRA